MKYLFLFLGLCTRIKTGGNNSLLIMGHKTRRRAFILPIGDDNVDFDRVHQKSEFQSTRKHAKYFHGTVENTPLRRIRCAGFSGCKIRSCRYLNASVVNMHILVESES
ncbi:hypothetical protein BJ912DRAFT_962345 [Pholiota molesta]|nr:hypothetical protein BJ912DRAFT_962345 [Pholiota molesta]